MLVSCSSQSDESIFNNAGENLKRGNYLEALSGFEKIALEYKKSDFRANSLFELAKLYHGGIAKNLSREESLSKAIEYYKLGFEDYPDSSYAPKSLFMVAFVQANELNQLDDARQNYNLFLSRYKDHEMAVSAKEELENLGLSAEEILRKKIVSESEK